MLRLDFLQRKKREHLDYIARKGSELKVIPSRFSHNRTVVLASVAQNGLTLQYASKRLRNNKNVVVTALNQDGLALQFASYKLRCDLDVVELAVRQNEGAVKYVPREILLKEEAARRLVKLTGLVLEFVTEALRNDRCFVLTAICDKPHFLRYASENLRNDREIVVAAVKKKGGSLRHASIELRDDPYIVLEATGNDASALLFASKRVRNLKHVVLKVVKKSGYSICYASAELRNDQEVVLAAVRKERSALQNASEERFNDPMILTAYLENAPISEGLDRLQKLCPVGKNGSVFTQINCRLEKLANVVRSGRIPKSAICYYSAHETARKWLRQQRQINLLLRKKFQPVIVAHVLSYTQDESDLAEELLSCGKLIDAMDNRSAHMGWEHMLLEGEFLKEIKMDKVQDVVGERSYHRSGQLGFRRLRGSSRWRW